LRISSKAMWLGSHG